MFSLCADACDPPITAAAFPRMTASPATPSLRSRRGCRPRLAKRRRGHAAECDRADPDLAPEVEIAPAIGTLGLEFFHGGQRFLAHRAELHGIGGLDHLG